MMNQNNTKKSASENAIVSNNNNNKKSSTNNNNRNNNTKSTNTTTNNSSNNSNSNEGNKTNYRNKRPREDKNEAFGALIKDFSNQQEDSMTRLSFLFKMAQTVQNIDGYEASPLTSFLLNELREVAHNADISISKKVQTTMCDYCSSFQISGKTCTTRIVSKRKFTRDMKNKLYLKMRADENGAETSIQSTTTFQGAKKKVFRLPKNAIVKCCLLCKHKTVLPGFMTSFQPRKQSQAKKGKSNKGNNSSIAKTTVHKPVSHQQGPQQAKAKNVKDQKGEERLPTSLKEMVKRESSSKKQTLGNVKNLDSLKSFLKSI